MEQGDMSNLYGPRIVTDGLVFNMDFGNTKCYTGTGSTCTDLSGNNFTGELVNTPTFQSTVNNKNFAFATNDYIRIQNSVILNTNTVSVEVWFKTNGTNQNGFWFEKGTVNTQYSLFQETGSVAWRHNIAGVGMTTLYTNTVNMGINTSSWFQIVGTYTSGSRIVYLNGVAKNSDTRTGTINVNTGGMSIGAYGGYTGSTGRSYYYNGNIAIVNVYNKALSVGEIQQNYESLKGRFGL